MKNPSNYPIKSFARLKKIATHIFKKSVALIVSGEFLKTRLKSMCDVRVIGSNVD